LEQNGFEQLVGRPNPSLYAVFPSLKDIELLDKRKTETLEHQHVFHVAPRQQKTTVNHKNRRKTLCNQLVSRERSSICTEFLVAVGKYTSLNELYYPYHSCISNIKTNRHVFKNETIIFDVADCVHLNHIKQQTLHKMLKNKTQKNNILILELSTSLTVLVV